MTKTQNLLSSYQSVSFDETCAPINIFRRGGGGGGVGGQRDSQQELELIEKKHLRLSPIIFCLNDNPWLTYFMARSFCNLGLDSLEIIASCDWEVGLSLLKMTSEISVKCH